MGGPGNWAKGHQGFLETAKAGNAGVSLAERNSDPWAGIVPDPAAVTFFHEHAGWSYDPATQTPEQGRQQSAYRLAQAERLAVLAGADVEWSPDWDVGSHRDFYGPDSAYEDREPETCENADLKVGNELIGSLGCVDDATEDYRRVVSAELAAEHAAELMTYVDADAEACPVCSEPSDYCQGHGRTGDPAGFYTLKAAEAGAGGEFAGKVGSWLAGRDAWEDELPDWVAPEAIAVELDRCRSAGTGRRPSDEALFLAAEHVVNRMRSGEITPDGWSEAVADTWQLLELEELRREYGRRDMEVQMTDGYGAYTRAQSGFATWRLENRDKLEELARRRSELGAMFGRR